MADYSTLLRSCLYNLDPDGDNQPNEDRADVADEFSALLPIPTNNQFQTVWNQGGILLSGEIFLPEVLRDPVGVISSIDWTPPEFDPDGEGPLAPRRYQLDDFVEEPLLAPGAFGEYTAWIGAIVDALVRDEAYGRLQMYVPSPAALFDLATYTEPYGSDAGAVITPEQFLNAGDPRVVAEPPLAGAAFEGYLDLDDDQVFTLGVDTPLRVAASEPCWDGNADGFCNPVDGREQRLRCRRNGDRSR
jgi:hypothetical protein